MSGFLYHVQCSCEGRTENDHAPFPYVRASYVTPGTDATVSWGGPDYKFVNNSSAAIGIRASYYNQTCTVSIYGIPVLEDGVTHSLKSTKLSETDPPAPTYEEDPTLTPGTEKSRVREAREASGKPV